MADELLSALGKLRREELATEPTEGEPVHVADPMLTTTERNRVLDAVFAKLEVPDTPRVQPPGATPTEAKVLSPSRWRPAAMLAAALAIAAAVVLVLARPGGDARDDRAPLPSFSITRLEGGASAVRSDPGTRPLQLRSAHDTIDLVITPGARIHDELGVVVVARPADGAPPRIATITKQVDRSADGAIRIEGPLDQFIALDPGAWKLEWLLSRAGAEPTTIAAVDEATASGAWRRVTMEAIIASD